MKSSSVAGQRDATAHTSLDLNSALARPSSVVARGSRPGTAVAAFLVGLPLAAALLWAVHHSPIDNDAIRAVRRYVTYPVQWAVVGMFFCALGTLLAKLWHSVAERRACRALNLPAWDGKPVPATDANRLAGWVDRLSYRLRRTFIARRVLAVLDYLSQRKSAAGLDDQARALADTDALELEGSYALTRFITWAIPILGFLGTVLGITAAISGVKADDLNLSSVTGGLAEAFDSTALALALTMVTMFCSFVVERLEQGILNHVDHYVETQLIHRFQRSEVDVIATSQSQGLVEIAEKLVQRQAELWARTFTEKERQSADLQGRQQDRVAAALETALERTLQTHTQRLASLEKQAVEESGKLLEDLAALAAAVRDTGREHMAGLARVGEMMAAQATTLVQIQAGEKQLIQLQTVMHQNLSALAGAGAFEQAVHNLTAAVHLLTSRTLPFQVAAQLQAPPPRVPTGKAA